MTSPQWLNIFFTCISGSNLPPKFHIIDTKNDGKMKCISGLKTWPYFGACIYFVKFPGGGGNIYPYIYISGKCNLISKRRGKRSCRRSFTLGTWSGRWVVDHACHAGRGWDLMKANQGGPETLNANHPESHEGESRGPCQSLNAKNPGLALVFFPGHPWMNIKKWYIFTYPHPKTNSSPPGR